MSKNEFKKQDANGNRLKDEIGTGLNEDHLRVMNLRSAQTFSCSFLEMKLLKEKAYDAGYGNSYSKFIRVTLGINLK